MNSSETECFAFRLAILSVCMFCWCELLIKWEYCKLSILLILKHSNYFILHSSNDSVVSCINLKTKHFSYRILFLEEPAECACCFSVMAALRCWCLALPDGASNHPTCSNWSFRNCCFHYQAVVLFLVSFEASDRFKKNMSYIFWINYSVEFVLTVFTRL